ncbi:MAG: Eco57I restriction-modification methylase domain-containing protein [Chitinispirillales bacterium]|jgi:hypothetical protein|nr:Eco57I restriction-modification methylase domain-containing protein [Chitinispirillales bacterium]
MTVSITKAEFAAKIKGFKHKELFNYMGWDKDRPQTRLDPLQIDGIACRPEIIADKRGFKVITIDGAIPAYTTRAKIAKRLKATFHNHILIFADAKKQEQLWLYSYNDGKKDRKTEIRHSNSQDAERLYQRASGLIFEIDEQDAITIVDVSARVRGNLAGNAEKVTKKFYEHFKKEHTKLSGFIHGIVQTADREWYASIMLNRLMFCYFMQRRGFLDNDRNYLRNKLKECKTKLGKGKFYSFYRSFLLVLFQQGLGSCAHAPKIKELIGRIPYLNGGLFDIHEIERRNPDINIPDKAFEAIFALFDEYEWHLDTRDSATGNEINPDVIGYIFEKYINDRAEMGAYYTQEDITGYISRNAILPYLLNAVEKNHPTPFAPNGAVWNFLKASGDEYIFESVKKGVRDNNGNPNPLPDHITRGIDPSAPNLLERRKRWNEPAAPEYALPTETWRETVERRKKYEETATLIKTGNITDINAFITHNIDIVNFANDLLDQIESPKFIMEFYRNLEKLTVLDPTCGSGAFLFAAMNILEPLYDSCLSRMEDYIRHDHKGSLDRKIKIFFEEKVNLMNNKTHPCKSYFIYKTIILNNLYGVDIMREAAETAKLRLFLKLVSTVDPDYRHENLGIEPLPDIDFNIKAGNTLVGIANRDGIKEALFGNMFAAELVNKINEDMKDFETAVKDYKRLQLEPETITSGNADAAKKNLLKKQAKLKKTLDELLKKSQYNGVKISDEAWRTEYAPFHWVAEFYGIVEGDGENGGFDVVIGNPPYVEYSKVKTSYTLKNYETSSCGNLYAFVIEMSSSLLKEKGILGLIVPMSITSIRSYKVLREYLAKSFAIQWITNHAIRPNSLFTGVAQRVSILLGVRAYGISTGSLLTTKYLRRKKENHLFQTIYYQSIQDMSHADIVPKFNNALDLSIYKKVVSAKKQVKFSSSPSKYVMYIKDYGETYWIFPFSFLPYKTTTNSFKEVFFDTNDTLITLTTIMNSSLFYWFYTLVSDCWHFGTWHIEQFMSSVSMYDKIKAALHISHKHLMESYKANRITRYDSRVHGKLYEYQISLSKPIIDQIDAILAQHYGFTDEELDYIINYDIKYRMGLGFTGGESLE